MTSEDSTLIAAIATTLTTDGWTLTKHTSRPAQSWNITLTGPDRTTTLVITKTPDQPPVAELTGHPAANPATTTWALSITNPTAAQLIPIARTAAYHRLREILTLLDNLERTGWTPSGDTNPANTLTRTRRDNASRTLTHVNVTEDNPGGWTLTDEKLQADATDNTPVPILIALAATPARSPEPTPPQTTTNTAEETAPTAPAPQFQLH